MAANLTNPMDRSMIILACLLLIAFLALLGGGIVLANRLVEDSAVPIPGAVRWLLRTCGDFWWAPPAAWAVLMVGASFLAGIHAGIAVTALACLALAAFAAVTWRWLNSQG